MNENTNESRTNSAAQTEPIDKGTRFVAIAVVLIIIAMLFLFSAWQTGLLGALGGSFDQPEAPAVSGGVLFPTDDVVSTGDAVEDTVVTATDTVSDSEVNIVYYPEVHIEGIVLPEEYGAGLFDAEAAMWLINEYRRQNGLYELFPGEFSLEQVTRIRLEEVMESFAHERPDGSEFSTVYTQTGLLYAHCAENLALGQYTAEEVVRDWIESDSHRAILLSENVTRMCVMTDMTEDGRAVWVFEAYSPWNG